MDAGILIVYTFKVTIYMLLFFAFNKLLLSKETFHNLNRWLWLSLVTLSFVLPLVDISGTSAIDNMVDWSQYSYAQKSATEVAVVDYKGSGIGMVVTSLYYIYLVGLVLFALHRIFIYSRLVRFILGSTTSGSELLESCKKSLGISFRVNLIVHSGDISPFSWLNYIVISESDLRDGAREILTHELTHMRSAHSIDIIFMDLVTVVQWYNPASWLIKRELQQVHEYSADLSTIASGANIKEYQLLLIKKAVGQQLHSMANSFNHSNLKKRITMMYQKKSNRWAAAKSLYAIPLMLLAVAVYANPTISRELEEISEVKVSKNLSEDQKVIVKNQDQEEGKQPLIILDGKEYKGSMDDIDSETVESINVYKEEAAIELYGAEKGANGAIVIISKKEQAVKVVSMDGQMDMNNALVIVDGKVGDLSSVEGGNISVTVMKNIESKDQLKEHCSKITQKEFEKAKSSGVVIVTTK